MNRRLIIVTIIMLIVGLVVYSNTPAEPVTSPPNAMLVSKKVDTLPYTAHFYVYTNSLERNFDASMYHNLSDVSYIDPVNTTSVIVTQENVTWRSFFDTLPFSVDEDCLVTGLGEEYCTSSEQQLKFYLNGAEMAAALDEEIRKDDVLVISYGTYQDSQNALNSVSSTEAL